MWVFIHRVEGCNRSRVRFFCLEELEGALGFWGLQDFATWDYRIWDSALFFQGGGIEMFPLINRDLHKRGGTTIPIKDC